MHHSHISGTDMSWASDMKHPKIDHDMVSMNLSDFGLDGCLRMATIEHMIGTTSHAWMDFRHLRLVSELVKATSDPLRGRGGT